MQMLGDSAIRLSWGRSAVAARPAGQLRAYNPVAYPTAAFGALQPAAAAAYGAPFGYGIGQPAGMPNSLYPGLPQVSCLATTSLVDFFIQLYLKHSIFDLCYTLICKFLKPS